MKKMQRRQRTFMFYILFQMKYILAMSPMPNRCVYMLLSGKLKEEEII